MAALYPSNKIPFTFQQLQFLSTTIKGVEVSCAKVKKNLCEEGHKYIKEFREFMINYKAKWPRN
jgi:hypothetical protein